VSDAGNDFLAREGVEDQDLLAVISRNTLAILIDSIDSQGQFFGARFRGRFLLGAAVISGHGIS
jgi:hypothetical protein